MNNDDVKFFRKTFEANQNGRDFVIGDLHGCIGFLNQALNHVQFDKEKDLLFSVGDLIDRGPSSLDCLMLILEPWFHAVKGNHENMLQWYLEHPDNHFFRKIFLRNGGNWILNEDFKFVQSFSEAINDLPTFMTVKKRDGSQFHILHAELLSSVPVTDEQIEDEKFLKDLMTRPDPAEQCESVLWSRAIFSLMYNEVQDKHALNKFVRFQKINRFSRIFNDELSVIYSGHTPMRGAPLQFKNQIVLDTAAFMAFKSNHKDFGLSIIDPETGMCWISNTHGVNQVSVTNSLSNQDT